MKIQLSLIRPSPRPVRSSWDKDKLEELTQSIKEQGLIVPVKVRPVGEEYELVYGHRRTEAARRAGLEDIEAIVEGVDDTPALWQALIENVMDEAMLPMDVAKALGTLKEETGWTNEKLGAQVGWTRQRIEEYLRLLRDPEPIVRVLQTTAGQHLSERLISKVRSAGIEKDEDRAAVLQKAADEELSSRQAERVAKTIARTQSPDRRKFLLGLPYSPYTFDPETAEREERGDRVREGYEARQRYEDAPGIRKVCNAIRRWRQELQEAAESIRVGKASPEAKRFIARRLGIVIQELEAWKEELQA